MSLTLASADIARLLASTSKRARPLDPEARAIAKQTKDDAKRAAIQAAEDAVAKRNTYSEDDARRIATLQSHFWPRARAMRNAHSAVREAIRLHYTRDKNERVELSPEALYDAHYREFRLNVLNGLVLAASARYGAFPICRDDLNALKSRFMWSGRKRHFTFTGGRDWGSREFEPSDLLQGAFVRAIETGDTVHGIPTFGAMFRHVQAERAYRTAEANREYSARKRAALGWTTGITERERLAEYPETKHTLRLLDTRDYASTRDHRAALADAHRDDELMHVDEYVSRTARENALGTMPERDEEPFYRVVADLIMAGHSLATIARAMGLTVATVTDDVHKSRAAELMPLDSGIDHDARSIDTLRADEREREIDDAQARHAATMRERYVTAQTAHYAMGRAL